MVSHTHLDADGRWDIDKQQLLAYYTVRGFPTKQSKAAGRL